MICGFRSPGIRFVEQDDLQNGHLIFIQMAGNPQVLPWANFSKWPEMIEKPLEPSQFSVFLLKKSLFWDGAPPLLEPQLTLREREFFIDNLLVRIHRCFWWTGLAPWEFEFLFPGSLISTFLGTPFFPHGVAYCRAFPNLVLRFARVAMPLQGPLP